MEKQPNISTHTERIISILNDTVNPQKLKKRFDQYMIEGCKPGKDIQYSSKEGMYFGNTKLSKDKVQQEMYTNGYKRVTKKEELDELSKKYCLSQAETDELKKQGSRFFIQVFPTEGQDNLVVVEKQEDMCFVSAFTTRKRVTETIAQKANFIKSRPAIDKINIDDNKGKQIIFEVSVSKFKAQMSDALGIKATA
jgi:hypothetical protein